MSDMIPAWIDGRLVPAPKLEVHRKGIRHKAVSVFVVDGDRTLIQKRAEGKYHTPGLWANTCCTHPRWGESAADCATRRLAEELGISGLSPNWREEVEYRADVGGGMTEHEVVDLFVAEAGPDLVIDPDPAEVAETRWIELRELARDARRRPDLYTPWLRIYLSEHGPALFSALAGN